MGTGEFNAGVTLRWTSILFSGWGGGRNTPTCSRFMLLKSEKSAGVVSHLARMQTLPSTNICGGALLCITRQNAMNWRPIQRGGEVVILLVASYYFMLHTIVKKPKKFFRASKRIEPMTFAGLLQFITN